MSDEEHPGKIKSYIKPNHGMSRKKNANFVRDRVKPQHDKTNLFKPTDIKKQQSLHQARTTVGRDHSTKDQLIEKASYVEQRSSSVAAPSTSTRPVNPSGATKRPPPSSGPPSSFRSSASSLPRPSNTPKPTSPKRPIPNGSAIKTKPSSRPGLMENSERKSSYVSTNSTQQATVSLSSPVTPSEERENLQASLNLKNDWPSKYKISKEKNQKLLDEWSVRYDKMKQKKNDELKEKDKQVKNLKKELNDLNLSVVKKDRKRKEADDRVEKLEKQLKEKCALIATKDEKISELKDKSKKLQTRMDKRKSTIEEMVTEKNKLVEVSTKQREKFEGLSSEMAEALAQLEKAKKEKDISKVLPSAMENGRIAAEGTLQLTPAPPAEEMPVENPPQETQPAPLLSASPRRKRPAGDVDIIGVVTSKKAKPVKSDPHQTPSPAENPTPPSALTMRLAVSNPIPPPTNNRTVATHAVSSPVFNALPPPVLHPVHSPAAALMRPPAFNQRPPPSISSMSVPVTALNSSSVPRNNWKVTMNSETSSNPNRRATSNITVRPTHPSAAPREGPLTNPPCFIPTSSHQHVQPRIPSPSSSSSEEAVIPPAGPQSNDHNYQARF